MTKLEIINKYLPRAIVALAGLGVAWVAGVSFGRDAAILELPPAIQKQVHDYRIEELAKLDKAFSQPPAPPVK